MKNIQKYRRMVQLLCVALTVFGFFTNFQVTMIIIMAATFIGGAYYCGWVCPMGTLQDLTSTMGKALGIKKVKMPRMIQRYLKYSRYILAIAFTVFSLEILFTLFVYDPRVNLLQILGGTFTGVLPLMVMISFLIIGMFFDRPFCNYLCVEGAKYGVFSSLRMFTIKRSEASCVDCSKCDKVCPMNIEVSKKDQVQSLQCVNCFQCVSACPVKDTLTYEKVTFTDKIKRKYKVVGSLIAIVVVVGGVSVITTGSLPFDLTLERDGSEAESVDAAESDMEVVSLTEAELEALGDAKGVEDGVYEGTGIGFRGDMTVEVTVVRQMITEVEVTQHSEDRKFYNRAEPSVTEDIVESQSVNVDSVSGATYSSVGIMDAVEDALDTAKKMN